MTEPKKKGKGKLETLGAILVAGLLLALYAWDQYRTSPLLASFGTQEWKTTCTGEGRVYRLHSTDRRPDRSRGTKNIKRALRFLGEDGETRYYTQRYEHRSMERDGVWRFQYNPKDVRLVGHKDQAAVLHGDEQTFEIGSDLDEMVIVRKEAPPLRLPCKPGQIKAAEKLFAD